MGPHENRWRAPESATCADYQPIKFAGGQTKDVHQALLESLESPEERRATAQPCRQASPRDWLRLGGESSYR
jgi:hypothetical protein